MTDHLNPHKIYPEDTSRGYHRISTRTMANQCAACGAETPEGDQVCRSCREWAEFDRCRDKNLADRIEALEAELAILRRYKKRLEEAT